MFLDLDAGVLPARADVERGAWNGEASKDVLGSFERPKSKLREGVAGLFAICSTARKTQSKTWGSDVAGKLFKNIWF